MKANKLLTLLKNGGTGIGLFADIDSSIVAEGLAGLGFDFIFVDQQHGLIGDKDMLGMITAINTTECTPIVRVSSNEPGAIMRALDYGALGVVCPLVNTGEEAARFVEATRYPPEGGRSWGPMRPNIHYGSDYTLEANNQILAIAQIETREAIDNLDDILATPHLDGILVGPNDLGFTYGNWPKAMPDDKQVVEAMKRVAKACAEKGIFAGIHCGDTAMAREMFDWGYRFASVSTDIGYLLKAASETLETLRGGKESLPGY
ncbi:HpcH/HpaI aldolase family protein [Aestuariispira insulae]|uniref:4-hydroxy-2-oxoheptanedioate aldolase n=1 Tax=Aestuariispira insulae TaxID=1461337 RepID=A0A3D9HXJ3_9PROT|nr:aldolase/citrate lyase family protein [Aestuariispira insulae]RED54214.1 4-hydroxy-2-oxoheptanedioate aldolase [Aestuariispira insulae]